MSRTYASLPQMNMPFDGAKLAILFRDSVVTILRDDIEGIPFPAYWDFSGGGREGEESPLDCALRETREELDLVIEPNQVRWGRSYGSDQKSVWLFVHHAEVDPANRIMLGDEGQIWRMMPIATFLQHPRAIPSLQGRLCAYCEEVQFPIKAPRFV